MANSLPFNAVAVDGEYDRVYKAEDWAWYFATFIANGIFPKPSDGLQVVAYSGMEIRVNAGYAFINGYAFRNPATLSVTLDTAEGALNRVDRVVVRWDLPQRDMYIAVLKGTPSAKPTATAVTRTTEIWELALADIYVGKGVTRIQTQNITDQRFNSAVCGIVTGTVEEIDASVLTKQFTDFFNTYSAAVLDEFSAYKQSMEKYLKKSGGSRAFLMSGPHLAKMGLVEKAANSLKSAGISVDTFTDIEGNPSVETVDKATAAFKEAGADFIVAFGGGSPMDVAKAVGVTAKYGGSITEYEGAHKVPEPIIPLIAIPTTAGTGSEVTAFSVITDHSRDYKLTVFSYEILPVKSSLIPAAFFIKK